MKALISLVSILLLSLWVCPAWAEGDEEASEQASEDAPQAVPESDSDATDNAPAQTAPLAEEQPADEVRAPAEASEPYPPVEDDPNDSAPNLGRDLNDADFRKSAESPKTMSFHIAFGAYNLANIDKGSSSEPGRSIFGNANELMFQGGFEYLAWQGFGSVGIEGAVGYWSTEGKGLYQSGTASTDKTSLEFVPFKLSGVYKFDWFKDEYNIPLVPMVKFGFDYYLWWVSNQRDNIARYETESGSVKKGMGGTFGLHVAYGVLFNLDIIDPKLASNFDYDVGVNDTYLYIEGVYSYVDDFGSGSSWDMSDHSFLAGLQLEF